MTLKRNMYTVFTIKTMPRLVLLVVFGALICSCSQHANTPKTEHSGEDPLKRESVVATEAHLLMGYWQGYDFSDPENINNPERGEQSLVDFMALFPKSSIDDVSRAVKSMLAHAKQSPAAFAYFTKQYERYLYDPNSPMRNDLYYEPVLEFLLDSVTQPEAEKIKTQIALSLVRKNKPGAVAADFSFVLPDGQRNKLSAVQSPLTLLFFYEPGCAHCEEAITAFKGHAVLNKLIEEKLLVFLAVYPFGGRDIWESDQKNIPRNWVNGFDDKDQVLKGGLYDLKATPTIFLLDQDKRVIVKDADISAVLAYFG